MVIKDEAEHIIHVSSVVLCLADDNSNLPWLLDVFTNQQLQDLLLWLCSPWKDGVFVHRKDVRTGK